MALRKILTEGDEQLLRHSRKVEKFDDRLHTLIDDMRETLENSGGVGLAAPQVGILRRIAVVDVGEGVIEMVNPVIVEQSGEQECVEGCLSFPGEYGITKRPYRVLVRAQDRSGKFFELASEGFRADACCHEIDHLDGINFKAHTIRMLSQEELENMK